MLLDQVSNPGPLTYESGALTIALRGPAKMAPLGKIAVGTVWLTPLHSELSKLYRVLEILSAIGLI